MSVLVTKLNTSTFPFPLVLARSCGGQYIQVQPHEAQMVLLNHTTETARASVPLPSNYLLFKTHFIYLYICNESSHNLKLYCASYNVNYTHTHTRTLSRHIMTKFCSHTHAFYLIQTHTNWYKHTLPLSHTHGKHKKNICYKKYLLHFYDSFQHQDTYNLEKIVSLARQNKPCKLCLQTVLKGPYTFCYCCCNTFHFQFSPTPGFRVFFHVYPWDVSGL